MRNTCSTLVFHFILSFDGKEFLLLFYISFYIHWYYFIQIFKPSFNLIWKNICYKFAFNSNTPKSAKHDPNFFCWCSLKGWHQLQQQTSIATFKQLYPIEMWWCCLKKIPVYSSRFQPLPHGKLKIILQLILQVILIHNFIIHIFDRLWWLYSTFLITGYGTVSLS